MLIHNAILHTPTGIIKNGWILIGDTKIISLGSGELPPVEHQMQRIDAQGKHLLPGFIDTHVHGGFGFETMQATPEAFAGMARFFASCGVTSFVASTIAESAELTSQVFEAARAFMATQEAGARLLGIHLEGPYINACYKGAHPEQHIRPPTRAEYRSWFATGVVKKMTVAPEIEGADELIAHAHEAGVVVSIGHSSASYQEAQLAFSRGVRSVTHLFNAMPAMHHRKPGLIAAALMHPEVMVELIVDMIHVDPVMVDLACRLKGVENVLLVTDAEIGAGMPQGMYTFGSHMVFVKDGAVRLADGTLFGSTLTMNQALRHCMAATGLSLQEAWPMSSLNGARHVGLAHETGALRAGLDADMVLVDDQLAVALTISRGKVVF